MRRLAALAAVIALAGFAALFLTEASAQTIDITSTIRSTAEVARRDVETILHGAGGRSLAGESTITGPVTLEIEFSSPVTTPTLALFSVTNATLSNLQSTSAYRNWTFLLTPTADGPVSVTLPASSVQLTPGGFNRWNTASTYSATADLGAPTIVWRGFSSTSNKNNQIGPYNVGDPIDMTVTYSENVTVVGAPYIRLAIGAQRPQLAYQSGSGTDTLVFRYTIPSGFPSTRRNPIVLSSGVELPSGASITDSAGTAAVATLPPQVVSILHNTAIVLAGATSNSAAVGIQYDWLVTYDRAVTVTQADGADPAYLRVRTKKQDSSSITLRANYAAGSGTATLTFRYTVRAADSIQSGCAFNLLANHVWTPNGFTISDAAGVDAVTQFGRYYRVARAREQTRVQVPFSLGSSAPADRTYHFTSSDADRLSVEPASLTIRGTTDAPNDWRRCRQLVAVLNADADADNNSASIQYRIESTHSFVDGQTGAWVSLQVLDDDPEVDTLTAASQSIAEGETAQFSVQLSAPPPVAGRSLHATVAQSGDCLSSALADADTEAAGLQQAIPLSAVAGQGVGTLSLQTVDDAVREADCVVSVTLAPPAAASAQAFAIAGATSLQQSVTVRDNDGGRVDDPIGDPDGPADPPPNDNLPAPLEPPELEDLTIIEGQSAEGVFDLGDSDRPRAAIEFFHRFRPDGKLQASPDPARFERDDWWRRQTWKLTAPQDADSDDEIIRWYLDADSDDRQWDNIYVHRTQITIRDDDPQVSALEALNRSVIEGDTAIFRLRISKAPLFPDRTVRLTLNIGGDMLAAELVDSDPQVDGIQLDLSLADAVTGSPLALRIPTQDDDQDEVDGILILMVEQPADHTAPNYFTLADGQESFIAAISVLDNDEPPPVEEIEEPKEVEEPTEVEEPEEVEEPTEEVEEPTEVEEPEELEEPVEVEEPEEVEEPVTFPDTGSGGLADSSDRNSGYDEGANRPYKSRPAWSGTEPWKTLWIQRPSRRRAASIRAGAMPCAAS